MCLSPTEEFQQVSFVNGIFTSKGGKHVDYILNQIIKQNRLSDFEPVSLVNSVKKIELSS